MTTKAEIGNGEHSLKFSFKLNKSKTKEETKSVSVENDKPDG